MDMTRKRPKNPADEGDFLMSGYTSPEQRDRASSKPKPRNRLEGVKMRMADAGPDPRKPMLDQLQGALEAKISRETMTSYLMDKHGKPYVEKAASERQKMAAKLKLEEGLHSNESSGMHDYLTRKHGK